MSKKTAGTVASIAAFAVIATGVIWGSFALRDAQSVTPEPTTVVQVQPRGFVSEPTAPRLTPGTAGSVATDTAVSPSGPTLCPEGTVAGAVDEAGNESACYETNDDGQQCVAYDDANNCTQYYKP